MFTRKTVLTFCENVQQKINVEVGKIWSAFWSVRVFGRWPASANPEES